MKIRSSSGSRSGAGLEGCGKDTSLGSRGNGEPRKGSGQEHKLSMCYFSKYPLIAYGVQGWRRPRKVGCWQEMGVACLGVWVTGMERSRQTEM